MKTIIAPSPKIVTIAVTDVCPFKCVMCFHSYQPRDVFKPAYFPPRAVRDVIANSSICGLHGIGEPQTASNFWEFIPDHVPTKCLLGWNTLGHHLSERECENIVERNVAWLNFSICAGTPATYQRVHGVKWEHLWRGVDRLIAHRNGWRRPVLKASMIVMRENVSEIVPLVDMCKSRDFESLLLYHLNDQHDVPNVPWNVGEGEFNYSDQASVENEGEHVLNAVRHASHIDFKLMAAGRFLGEQFNHIDMRTAVGESSHPGNGGLL
jgi:MoaA/NifB/PqqE/SkfB family radical SAM enzyme